MKNKINIFIAIVFVCFGSACFGDYPEGDIYFLGYSDETANLIDEEIGLTFIDNYDTLLDSNKDVISIEVDSTVEQLKELGVSRSLDKTTKDRSEEVKDKNSEFWKKIHSNEIQSPKSNSVDEETKSLIKSNISKALTQNGYKIVQLELLPLPEYSSKKAVRAVVRVVKPFKSGNYNEIQNSLNNIKNICLKAATINNKCMLAEMSTFIAENPKNNYYYEKTILR